MPPRTSDLEAFRLEDANVGHYSPPMPAIVRQKIVLVAIHPSLSLEDKATREGTHLLVVPKNNPSRKRGGVHYGQWCNKAILMGVFEGVFGDLDS